MKYEIKTPSWNEICDGIKQKAKNVFGCIGLGLIIIVISIMTAVFYRSIINLDPEGNTALQEIYNEFTFTFNGDFLIILLILFISTTLLLYLVYYWISKFIIKSKVDKIVFLQLSLVSLGITLIYIIAAIFNSTQFSTIIGVISVIALSIQTSSLFKGNDGN